MACPTAMCMTITYFVSWNEKKIQKKIGETVHWEFFLYEKNEKTKSHLWEADLEIIRVVCRKVLLWPSTVLVLVSVVKFFHGVTNFVMMEYHKAQPLVSGSYFILF